MDYNGIITCTKDLIKSPIGPTFGPFLQYGLQVTKTMQAGQEKYKRSILNKYIETKNLPRKKKKQRRKELNLDWAFACYNPFDF